MFIGKSVIFITVNSVLVQGCRRGIGCYYVPVGMSGGALERAPMVAAIGGHGNVWTRVGVIKKHGMVHDPNGNDIGELLSLVWVCISVELL